MATNPINQPVQPFHVQSNLLNDAPQRNTSGPQGPSGPQTPSGSGPWNPSGDPIAGPFGWLAALFFVAIYAVSQQYVQLAPVTIVVLIACALFRLGAGERQFAAVPVALAGIRLALQMTSTFSIWTASRTSLGTSTFIAKPQEFGVTWLPIFFSICLFNMPKRISVTAKITLACSLILLVSGLLPGDGYLYMFAMVQYGLFLAMGVGLMIDFIPQPANSVARATPQVTRP